MLPYGFSTRITHCNSLSTLIWDKAQPRFLEICRLWNLSLAFLFPSCCGLLGNLGLYFSYVQLRTEKLSDICIEISMLLLYSPFLCGLCFLNHSCLKKLNCYLSQKQLRLLLFTCTLLPYAMIWKYHQSNTKTATYVCFYQVYYTASQVSCALINNLCLQNVVLCNLT